MWIIILNLYNQNTTHITCSCGWSGLFEPKASRRWIAERHAESHQPKFHVEIKEFG